MLICSFGPDLIVDETNYLLLGTASLLAVANVFANDMPAVLAVTIGMNSWPFLVSQCILGPMQSSTVLLVAWQALHTIAVNRLTSHQECSN